ncbi:hypothetical protein [Corynebacterium meitnerae]|uniref:Secreted protein n=1 Tax=Corynebacterium meitnerae TaxID=2913498 RepID=A0A9X3RJL7_9CORY|nr:hypothetical protein [Corynebacterium meitnerae]MCZ9293152.1 hypothetical protein [Corynebacterium meitnerae]
MKIRKSLLAAATAAAVSVSGVVAAPAFAADENTGTDNTVTAPENKDEKKPELTDKEKRKENSSKAARDMFYDYNKDTKEYYISPSKITAWIAVITSVLGLIGKVINFGQKNFKF